MVRATSSVLLAFLGLLLCGARIGWVPGDAARFRVAWLWRELALVDRVELLQWTEAWLPVGLCLAAAVSLALGWALGRWLAARLGPRDAPRGRGVELALTLGCALVFFLVLNPQVLHFVARRQPGGAAGYLDVQDQVQGLGLGLLALAALLGFAHRGTPAPGRGRTPPRAGRRLAIPVMVAMVVPVWLGQARGGGAPLTNDEVAYDYQAELFAAGELSAPRPDHAEFFGARQVVLGERWFSKYPPGHSLVLALGARLGNPALVLSLLAGLSVVWTWGLARRLGIAEPLLAAELVSISPLLLGVLGLSLAHSTSLPFAVLFALLALRALDEADEGGAALPWALAAGAALGAVLLTRPLTALALALPFAIELVRTRPPRAAALASAAALGSLPALCFFLWINHQLTGSALQTAYGLYAEQRSPDDHWGPVNLGTALPFTSYNATRLALWLHGGALGLVLPLVGWLFLRPPRRAWLTWGVTASLLALYALHAFHGIPWAGPLYLVEGLPLLVLLSAQGVTALTRGLGPRARWGLCAALGAALGLLLIGHTGAQRRQVALRQAPYRAALERGVERGLIFVRVERPEDLKLFPLLPPAPTDELVFAYDLGPRNAELRAALGDPPAWRYLPAEDRLESLP